MGMKTKFLIGVLLAGIVLIGGCIEKECETDSDCLSKTCFMAECTDNKCVYAPLNGKQPGCSEDVTCGGETCKDGVCEVEYEKNCCGNEICEPGETYENCSNDCPNCDDVNECTKDRYDYHEQKCVNTIIPNVICCGNGACEIGETYSNCAQDCPNCDDNNECTVDSYDYHEQKCVNEIIIPCCGNGICDDGAEDYSSCSADCPDCDDNDKFTEENFNYTTQKCEYIRYSLFDDFEEGNLDEWNIWRANPEDDWDVISENSNKIARGHGETDLHGGSESWVNYTFMWKLKLINQGGAGVWVRESGLGRYEFGIHENKIGLQVIDYNIANTPLTSKDLYLPLNKWHDFKIVVKGNNLKFYLNNKLIIDVDDEKNTFPEGRVGVKSHAGSEVYFDDFKVKES